MASDDDLAHVPNAKKIHTALTTGALKGKYTENSIGINLAEAFEAFVLGEQMENEQIAEDFDTGGSADDSFFIAFIQDEDNGFALNIKDTAQLKQKHSEIWQALSDALHDKLTAHKPSNTPSTNTTAAGPKSTNALYRIILPSTATQHDYNIIMPKHKEDQPGKPMWLQCIDHVLSVQCEHLRPQDLALKELKTMDKGTYSIIQIGKQNKNQPLLTYLADSFNRYRIQKRKRAIRKADQQSKQTGVDVLEAFRKNFEDPKVNKFIFDKCKGLEVLIGENYPEKQKHEFMEACKASIAVYLRRLVPSPPVSYKPGVGYSCMDDSIRDVCLYIFEAFSCVHQYAASQQQTAALPVQIDVVIIPRKSRAASFKQDEDGAKGGDADDESSEDEEEKQEQFEPMDDVDARLKGMDGVIKKGINVHGAERTMRQCVDSVIAGRRNQRVICVINRRQKTKGNDDAFYCYQTNAERGCHDFESNELLCLHESLAMNLRKCLLPKIGNEKSDVNVNRHNGDILTLSFQCFAVDEIRVYLYFDGWGTRFFIEDIKYYLPTFFTEEEQKNLRSLFEHPTEAEKQFAATYEQCKKKCVDPKFEQFYLDLLLDGKPCH